MSYVDTAGTVSEAAEPPLRWFGRPYVAGDFNHEDRCVVARPATSG